MRHSSWPRCVALTLCWLFATALLPLSAAPLPAPQDEVLLKITGNIDHPNVNNELHLDRQQMMSIATRVIETSTPWTDGVSRFEGPLFRSVLEVAGVQSDYVRVRALNNYAVEIPLSDLQQYDVILAIQQDGAPLGVRELGPIFVLYPFDEDPALFTQTVRHRSVWHVVSVEVP